MNSKSLSRALPAVLLLGFGLNCGPALAQSSDNLELGRVLRENDVPVRQGIASDGTQLHEGMDMAPAPMQSAFAEVSHQGRSLRSGINETRAGADSVGAYRNRVVCEHRRDSIAAEWRCKPHAQQR